MKIKVCGMKYSDNIKELLNLPIDMMGLIFYPKSPRYTNEYISNIKYAEKNIELVGVFVNESFENIITKVKEFNLNIVQLHGNEEPTLCVNLKKQGLKIIKAISIKDERSFNICDIYDNCDYLLFDTSTSAYGGSGKKFDWNTLSHYKGSTPFLLSGGIDDVDAEKIKNIKHNMFAGIDLNSKFELSPGMKDINKLKKFINIIRYEQD
ncbi:phosphoribosylanthranilate isomerase [Dysgonomonadaceae bacterium PH5-43]|nr:phosphoribosylanthranilate isomerase [Dysgonomonadaceae bacterium PH5-43]